MDSDKKIQRLVEIARLYYEEDENQSEIAVKYGISRPMVSKLLKEARDKGIVNIEIRVPGDGDNLLMERVKRQFGIIGGVIVPDKSGDVLTDSAIAAVAIRYLGRLGVKNLGIGWGHIIGNFVEQIEKGSQPAHIGESICPLIGNGGVGLKNYHSNELVRAIAEHSEARPEFLYSPAYMLSEQELRLIKELDNYHAIYGMWENLDTALVNIGNFPSVPDFASKARYGDLLLKRKSVGRILNYFIDSMGDVIRSDTDYAVQIPLELLKRIRSVVGICSANTKAKALRGALRTGYIGHVIAPASVVESIFNL